ncbi:MAG: 16S rRNA (cytosine(967)-C(5))-methyltransferase RsmB [Lachnospiraceae bacterium]
MTEVNTREVALDIIVEVMEKDGFTHIVLRQALEKYGYLSRQERAFISRLASGTIERAIELDYIIDQFSRTPSKKMKPVIRNLLRMTTYQLKYMNAIPASAACNEAVKLAQKRGFSNLKPFVNGVCRNIGRNIAKFQTYDSLELNYSVPSWLVQEWSKQYSLSEMDEMLAAMYQRYQGVHEVTVRCNESRQNLEKIKHSLMAQGITVREEVDWPQILHLSGMERMEDLTAFLEGWIQPQSLGSALIGRVAAPKPGDYCIDLCAAPGGKSLHLADLMADVGVVDSRDISFDKLALIEENKHRCGFSCIQISLKDAAREDEQMRQKANVVVADLPCSGLGIIGNKADIKYKMTLEKTKALAKMQQDMLAAAASYVKVGGTLVYSTCTIHDLENEENVRWFLKNFPFEPVDFSEEVPDSLKKDSIQNGMLQLLPGDGVEEGFFIAKLRRKEEL